MSATIRTNQALREARLLGIGGYRPVRIVPNAEIVERIDSSDEWIQQRTGIMERHHVDAGMGPA